MLAAAALLLAVSILSDDPEIALVVGEPWIRHPAGSFLHGNFPRDVDPPFADTPQWRAQLRDANKGGISDWQTGTKYQVRLIVNRFKDHKRPQKSVT